MSGFGFENQGQHASMNVSSEKHDEYAAQHDHIAKSIAALMQAGSAADSAEVQDWIAKHYAFVKQFWTPSRIAYKSLALTYVMDPRFKATYEAYAEGLAKFMQSAINRWADDNLA